MKRLFIVLLMFSFTTKSIHALQKENRLNIGIQGNIPERFFNSKLASYNNKNGGMGFHLGYTTRLHPRFSIGVTAEYAFVTENYQSDAIDGFDILSIAPTFNYYFTKHKIKPYAGIGYGLFHVIDHEPIVNDGIRLIGGVTFYNYFNLSVEYNRIFNKIEVNPLSHGAFDNYYLAVKGSISIGLGYSKYANQ
ncbi:MAG: hypothetical protein V4613_02665 [Bacteroidota bacterium]